VINQTVHCFYIHYRRPCAGQNCQHRLNGQCCGLVTDNQFERLKVFDLVMLGIGVGFFAIAVAYVAACDRL
jgi:hypothetical protein